MTLCITLPAFAAEQRGRPIEFSSPRSGTVSTNFNDATAEKLEDNALKQKLRQESSRPSEVIGPGGSLGGAIAIPYRPPPPPPARSERVKELVDQRKNWVFMSPDDLSNTPTLEEIFGVPEFEVTGEKKEKLSVVERFYQRLEEESNLKASRAAGKARLGSSEDDAARNEESPLARRLIEAENALKRIFDANKAGDYLPREDGQPLFSDWFGQAEPSAFSVERTPAQKRRLEEFKQLLETRPVLDSSPKYAPPARWEAGLPQPSAGWMPPALPSVPTAPSGISPVNELGGTTLPGLSSTSVGQPNYTPPPIPALPRSPQGAVVPPQRKF